MNNVSLAFYVPSNLKNVLIKVLESLNNVDFDEYSVNTTYGELFQIAEIGITDENVKEVVSAFNQCGQKIIDAKFLDYREMTDDLYNHFIENAPIGLIDFILLELNSDSVVLYTSNL